ncbi:hypothetical protein O6H91_08G080400 [Diphasiastrum complanatum]|uniref:Uncharacterized protein n=1 Tax=Diphasiastrum complanatum TaxID=34168 RepID=A0ACC2CZI9_DIPCM|nr:hypothetical protein O6H91_08G080400 [Diphasiastrum complanatum]
MKGLRQPWIAALLLLILSLGGYRAAAKFPADEESAMDGNHRKGFEEGFKGGGHMDGEDDAEEQLMMDFLKNLDEASVLAFMDEWSNWVGMASSSSCFNPGVFFERRQSDEQKADLKKGVEMGFGHVTAEEELDTLSRIDEVFGGVHESGKKCGAALLIGRRPTQEDRVLCLPELILPSLGGKTVVLRTLGFFGVFDGHNGEEASDFVSKCVHQYFLHQVYMILGSLITRIFSSNFTVKLSLSEMAAKITWEGSCKQDYLLGTLRTNADVDIYSEKMVDEEDIDAKHPISWNYIKQSFKDLLFLRDFLSKAKSSVAVADSCKMLASYSHDDTKSLLSRSCVITGVSQSHLVEVGKSSLGGKGDNSLIHDFSEKFYQQNNEAYWENDLRTDEDILSYAEGCKSTSIRDKSNFEAKSHMPAVWGSYFYRTFLKRALSKAIVDIDLAFYEEAKHKGWEGGTTACIALTMDGHVLIANLGDSKAFFCSFPCESMLSKGLKLTTKEKRWAQHKFQHNIEFMSKFPDAGTDLDGRDSCVEDLTQDHHPDRKEERLRIEAAGGYVEEWGGVPRLNGMLAVSRSIGDLPFKRLVTAQDSQTDSSDFFTQKLQIVDLPIPLPPKQEIRQQQESCTDSQNLSKAGKRNMSNSPGWRAAYSNATFSAKELSQMCPKEPRDGNKDIMTFKELVSENSRPNHYRLTEAQVLESHHLQQLNQQADPHDKHHRSDDSNRQLGLLDPDSIAQMIVEMAYSMGSTDNLAAVVLPLEFLRFQSPSSSFEQSIEVFNAATLEHEHAGKLVSAAAAGSTDNNEVSYFLLNHSTASTRNNFANELELKAKAENNQEINSTIVFKSGMLVTKQCHGCYELIERLSGDVVLPFPHGMEDEFQMGEHYSVERLDTTTKGKMNLITMGPGDISRQIQVYQDHQIWAQQIFQTEAEKGICAKGQNACQLWTLVGSVPLDLQTLSPTQLDEAPPYVIPHRRYILKKNVAHGAFGEIWLALRRNCLSDEDLQTLKSENENGKLGALSYSQFSENDNSTSCGAQKTWIPNISSSVPGGDYNYADDVYILKRILMKGDAGIPLSGHREKYFGEVFLNASIKQAKPANVSSAESSQKYKPCFISKHDVWKLNRRTSYSSATNYGYCVGDQQFKEFTNGSRDIQFQKIQKEEGLDHIARYVDSFEIQDHGELWLVFKMEGKSLSSLLYDSEGTTGHPGDFAGFNLLQPSHWWRWLKTTAAGQEEFRSLLKQLILGVRTCHRYNITHRDIKPENIVVHASGSQPTMGINGHPNKEWPSNLTLRLIDFGSALDPFTLEHLYGSTGPTEKEQTVEYSPPEALLWKHWLHFHFDRAHAYDMWSIGVVMLELILGTPHVFQVSSRTHALLDRHLDGWDEASKKTAYMLRAFMEMCILLPGVRPHYYHHFRAESFKYSEKFGLASWDCTEEALLQQIRQRDPLSLGMPDVWSLRLLRQLLQWYPEDRISAEDALQHPFFHPSLQATPNSK